MRPKMWVILMFGLIIFAQGCGTLKGAREGFKEDWKALQKTDDWIRENMW